MNVTLPIFIQPFFNESLAKRHNFIMIFGNLQLNALQLDVGNLNIRKCHILRVLRSAAFKKVLSFIIVLS